MIPRWAQKRAERLATGPHDRSVLVAYPQSRGVFALPITLFAFASVVNIGLLVVLLVVSSRTTGENNVATFLIAGIVFVSVLYAFVAYLMVESVRTSVLATPRGVEIRQLGMRDTFYPWQDIARVEEQSGGYWAGASVLALTSGQRIRIKATDPRRAKLYNGHGLREVHHHWLKAPMPWTQRLIDAHRAHLGGHV